MINPDWNPYLEEKKIVRILVRIQVDFDPIVVILLDFLKSSFI